MTERKLWNGWCDTKSKRRFLGVVLLFNVIAWITDAMRYENRLDWDLFTIEPLMQTGGPIRVTEYELTQGGDVTCGLFCAIVTVIYLAVAVVYRESFKENWYVTLRRVPDYRGKYLWAKLATVLFPILLFGVYGILQWCFQRRIYRSCVPEALRTTGVWRFAPVGAVLMPMVNLALFAISVLLLCFVLRNVKKDFIGGVAAIGGIGMMVVCNHVLNFSGGWQRAVVLSGVIGVELLFLVRHVYRKL